MTLLIIILLFAYVVGFMFTAYMIGLPFRGSITSVLIWAVAVAMWPVTLLLAVIIEQRFKL